MSGSELAANAAAPLAGTLVLDLTDHRGEVGPFILAELGADVIKVEPPGGSPSRAHALEFAAYNSNKRSVCLDLEASADRDTFEQLVGRCDFVCRSAPDGPFAPAFAEGGYDHEALAALNDQLIDVVITPFGASGPRANDPASELTLACLGGSANLQGVPQRAPVKASIPQVWRHAGAEGAVAALMARARQARAPGPQLVTVSAQAAVTWTLLNAMEAHAICGRDTQRTGTIVPLAAPLQLRHETKDGHVIVVARGVPVGRLLEWLIEENIVSESWRDEDWDTFDQRMVAGEPTGHAFVELEDAVAALCARYTNDELLRKGLTCGETIAPINTVADLVELTHLREREFWARGRKGFDDASGDAFETNFPGGFVKINGARVGGARSTPAAGEHNAQLPKALPAAPGKPRGSGEPTLPSERSLPFADLKIADFSWIGVGPITAKAFADHGATVVRIESHTRLDGLRVNPPFKDDVVDVDMAHFFGTFNTSKLSIDVDLANPAGVEVARKMIAWADVVIESWTPGTFARAVADDDTIRELNPNAVVVHTSLMGSGGELTDIAGFGYHAAAIAGFYPTVGWPDLPPDGPYLAYTDTISPRFITTTIAAALERRARTGEGCVIEAAQLECGLQFLAPELLDYQVNGRVATRNGNRDVCVAPQGVYPCVGDDRWIGITIDDDDCWARFVEAIDSPEWATDADLATWDGRFARHDELDELITRFTSTRDARALERTLCAHGVPAGVVQRSSDLLADPQYAHLRFYRYLTHQAMDVVPYAGHQYQIANYDHGPRAAAPTLGQHTHHVLTELLKLSDDEVAQLAISGALG